MKKGESKEAHKREYERGNGMSELNEELSSIYRSIDHPLWLLNHLTYINKYGLIIKHHTIWKWFI